MKKEDILRKLKEKNTRKKGEEETFFNQEGVDDTLEGYDLNIDDDDDENLEVVEAKATARSKAIKSSSRGKSAIPQLKKKNKRADIEESVEEEEGDDSGEMEEKWEEDKGGNTGKKRKKSRGSVIKKVMGVTAGGVIVFSLVGVGVSFLSRRSVEPPNFAVMERVGPSPASDLAMPSGGGPNSPLPYSLKGTQESAPQNSSSSVDSSVEALVGEGINLQQEKIISAVTAQNEFLKNQIKEMGNKIASLETKLGSSTNCNIQEITSILDKWWAARDVASSNASSNASARKVEVAPVVTPTEKKEEPQVVKKQTPKESLIKQQENIKKWKVIAISGDKAALVDEEGVQYFVSVGSEVKGHKVVYVLPESGVVVMNNGMKIKMSEK
jgi:hypothetical protein